MEGKLLNVTVKQSGSGQKVSTLSICEAASQLGSQLSVQSDVLVFQQSSAGGIM